MNLNILSSLKASSLHLLNETTLLTNESFWQLKKPFKSDNVTLKTELSSLSKQTTLTYNISRQQLSCLIDLPAD